MKHKGIQNSCVACCAIPILRNLDLEPVQEKNNFSTDSFSNLHCIRSPILKKHQRIRKWIARVVKCFLNMLKIRKNNTYFSKFAVKNQILSCYEPFWSLFFRAFKVGFCLSMQPWQPSENEAIWWCACRSRPLWWNQKWELSFQRDQLGQKCL